MVANELDWSRQRFAVWCVCVAAILLTTEITAAGQDASTLSQMECHSDDNGNIVCQVILNRLSESEWRIEHCIEEKNDPYCLEATFSRKPKPHEADTNKQDETTVMMGSDKNTDTEKYMVIGSRSYVQPFDSYGSEVARALNSISRSYSRNANDIDLADQLSVLALAHRGEAMHGSLGVDVEVSNDVLELAINAYEESLKLFKRVLPQLDNAMDRDDINIAIGITTSLLAESYQLHSDNSHLDNTLLYYRESEDTFHQLLQDAVSRLDETTFNDIELRWADVATRVGILLIESTQDTSMNILGASNTNMQLNQILDNAEAGKQKLKAATEVYRRAANRVDRDAELKRDHQNMVANNLHSSGSASLIMGSNEDVIQEWEEAILIYEDLAQFDDSDMQEGHLSLVAELSYSITEAYLQMGMYDEANEKYEKAMNLVSLHGVPLTILPSESEMDTSDIDKMLHTQEESLREYHESLYGGHEVPLSDEYSDADEQYYQADELYEVQLQATIGILKLTTHEKESALGHFQRALELYLDNVDGEDRFIADLKLNMALVYLFLEDYEESNKQHREAVEILRAVVGEGKNALIDEELLGLKGSALGKLDLKKQGSKQGDQEHSGRRSLQERLFDVDAYWRGLMNSTRVDAVPDADEL